MKNTLKDFEIMGINYKINNFEFTRIVDRINTIYVILFIFIMILLFGLLV